MKISKGKQFAITLAAFLVLGISFKVMVLIDGLTEVRPVNAIAPVAGLLCGWVGALACALGNLLADMTGTLSPVSILGVIGNFVAAYLPYRLWYMLSDRKLPGERPNLHSGRNILRYIVISLIAAMTVAWILSFGMYLFWGIWIEKMCVYIFWNNLGFSIGLGMPLLIILTSKGIHVESCAPPRKYLLLRKAAVCRIVCMGYLCLLLLLTASVLFGHLDPAVEFWMKPISALALAGLIGLLV